MVSKNLRVRILVRSYSVQILRVKNYSIQKLWVRNYGVQVVREGVTVSKYLEL